MTVGLKLLREAGLGGLPAELMEELAHGVVSKLEMTVGSRLAASVTPAVLDTFPSDGDEAAIWRWIQIHTPNHEQVTRHARAEAVAELRARREEILAVFTGPASREG